MRICSLLPSATEIVAALGLTDSLVGVSEECDFPPRVRELPVVSASRVDTSALSSLRIDSAVREGLASGKSLYAVDEELVRELRPDLILTQDLCAVCAVPTGELDRLCDLRVPTFSLDAGTIVEIEDGILTLAELLGVRERGEEVVAAMKERVAAVAARVDGAPRRTVFVAEWLDPPFAAGHWVPEMVAAAGGIDVLGRPGESSYRTTWEAVHAAGPELVVAAPCGFDHERTAREADLPELGCRAVAVDANAYYARPGPRVADGVEQLAFLIHPDRAPDPGLPYVELTRG